MQVINGKKWFPQLKKQVLILAVWGNLAPISLPSTQLGIQAKEFNLFHYFQVELLPLWFPVHYRTPEGLKVHALPVCTLWYLVFSIWGKWPAAVLRWTCCIKFLQAIVPSFWFVSTLQPVLFPFSSNMSCQCLATRFLKWRPCGCKMLYNVLIFNPLVLFLSSGVWGSCRNRSVKACYTV